MRRTKVLILVMFVLVTAGIVISQTDSPADFALVQTLGESPPRGIVYDANYDQYVWIDLNGQLTLADATTLEPRHTLYQRGSYNAYSFSNNGRWLALAIDQRVELWDTQSGELAATFNPDGALQTQGPLIFSEDDVLLQFNTLVRAPREIRQSEDDTINLSWIWDLPDGRGEASSTLPSRAEAIRFFDYRFGLVMGPNRTVIGGLPQRIQIVNVNSSDSELVAEIVDEDRFERDPVDVWVSLRDEQMYTRRVGDGSGSITQINTTNYTLTDIPLNRELSRSALAQLESLVLSDQARIIGESYTRQDVSFLRLLLGDDYHAQYNYRPLTITLLDILQPVVVTGESRPSFLLHIFDEDTGRSRIERITSSNILDVALHPNGDLLAIRRESGVQDVELYDLNTGTLVRTMRPQIPVLTTNRPVLEFNLDGSTLIADFHRFETATGNLITENLHINFGYQQFYFSPDSRTINTIDGSLLWTWEIATGEVIRRETLNTRGDVLRVSADGARYLTTTTGSRSTTVEVYDADSQTRRSVNIDIVAGRFIEQIIPSPDWEHYLVVYGQDQNSQHYPGNEIALYSLETGLMWFIAGNDLPDYGNRSYGWVDNQTPFIANEGGGSNPPERVYGLDYHSSGLPTCLVDVFPDNYSRWLPLWELVYNELRGNSPAQITINLCDAVTNFTSPDDVEAFFTPTPRPTEIFVTPQSVVIANVPTCLTSRFQADALNYAQAWRGITEDLTDEQRAELEDILCEGLQQGGSSEAASVGTSGGELPLEVMTINLETGRRSVGSYIPPGQPRQSRNLELVVDALERDQRIFAVDYKLSPDGRFIAVQTSSNHILVYRINAEYDGLIATITATNAVNQQVEEDNEIRIGLRPTSTPAFDLVGEPRPTLTPTITPTSPPLPEPTPILEAADQIEDYCPAETLYTPENLPEDYTPQGDIYVLRRDSNLVWRLDPYSGNLRPDEAIPQCGTSIFCNQSPDGEYILYTDENIILSRVDGSNAQVLFTAAEIPFAPQNFSWVAPHTLQYTYQGFHPEWENQVTLVQRIDPEANERPQPFVLTNDISVNGLTTSIISQQPNDGPVMVVRTAFDLVRNPPGLKYYIYNRDTESADYFARLTGEFANRDLSFEWNPNGTQLYFRYPNSDWYIYLPETNTYGWIDTLPAGTWSREGRYRINWFQQPAVEVNERREAGLPLYTISIWESDTGLTRRYCIPETDGRVDSSLFTWSPDSRYVMFRMLLPGDLEGQGGELARPRTLMLDTQTGTVTNLTFEITDILAWTQHTTHDMMTQMEGE